MVVRVQRCKQLLQRFSAGTHSTIVFNDEKFFAVLHCGSCQQPSKRLYYCSDVSAANSSGRNIGRKTHSQSVMKGLKINKEVYQDAIFEDILLPWTQTNFRQRSWTYQRDSTLAHKAKFMQQWSHANMPNFIDSSQRPPIPPI
ncbi:hypothetical protein WR25_03304 [Diploscapter pachys]|uniref:Uncharacterized protein n=1 Tax=Diploscapter pachys TaxID=2018661 RepID=A0A2A2L3H8_9BILA|nr:hypothetical protein WR25_03304 [Diploscapter pachys]